MEIDHIDRIIQLRKEGKGILQICEDIGFSDSVVHRYCRFLGIHGETVLRAVPTLNIRRKVSDYEFACMAEWAYQNKCASEPAAFVFLVPRGYLAKWCSKRNKQSEPLMGAVPAIPPKWISLNGENDVNSPNQHGASIEELLAYKQEVCSQEHYDAYNKDQESDSSKNDFVPEILSKAKSALKSISNNSDSSEVSIFNACYLTNNSNEILKDESVLLCTTSSYFAMLPSYVRIRALDYLD